MSSKRSQPSWLPPVQQSEPVLKLYNSFTRQKEIFVPANGKKVTWYSCGPTVYDASHMGHARSYITFDILRRVLSDYFGYDIFFAMNITDIDDKIIKRARQNYLFKEYVKKEHCIKTCLEDAMEIDINLQSVISKSTDPDKITMLNKLLIRVKQSVAQMEAATVNNEDECNLQKIRESYMQDCQDAISDWLDDKLGSTVCDNSIFNDLPRYWENAFHNDMEALNILPPNVLTRVSEYIPEIIEFIEKIVENGLAYVSNGSVYFDVPSFDARPNSYYAKLVPEAYGDTNSLQEGEGALSKTQEQLSEKKSPTDFALWKRSRPGEPSWESPWGLGRPGWHIECSAMAATLFGSHLDIHTGGVDLKFPHHDNEIAQSEAYFNASTWVNYFLHSGHLTIAGCKMSKSLKNFVSIQDALKNYTARQLRFAFIMHSWKDTLDYSPNTMDMALQYEKSFNEFFLNIQNVANGSNALSIFSKWSSSEIELNEKFQKTKENVHAALCDNIDTRSSLNTLRMLVTFCNQYMNAKSIVDGILLYDIASYITRIFTVFGIISEPRKIGFPTASTGQTNGQEVNVVMPYLRILADFRSNIRSLARVVNAKDILIECDRLRDDSLVEVGVRLEDREDAPSAIKIMDKEALLREKIVREKVEEDKRKKRQEALAREKAKEALKQIRPAEMFKTEEYLKKFSKFDENGLPTHDIDGNEISKGQLKKLVKLQQTQEKHYAEYLKTKI